MSVRIEETFQLRAPVDRVWRYLADPRQVVECLPGAELTDVRDDSTFVGRVKVKVGPITAAYSGTVRITARDDVARTISMVGEGRESAGSGGAKMTMRSHVAALPSGETEVRVTADVDIVGKAAQFGRGMIETVNKQMFRQFTVCVKGTLEEPASGAAGPMATTPGRPAAGPSDSVGPRPDDRSSADKARTGEPAARDERFTSPPPSRRNEPVRLIPVLFHAAVEMVGRFARSVRGALARTARR